MEHTDDVSAVSAPEAGSTTTRVVGAAINADGAVETNVVGAEVGSNLTRLACEPSFAVAHEVLQFVLASVAMTRVWVAICCFNYSRQNTDVMLPVIENAYAKVKDKQHTTYLDAPKRC